MILESHEGSTINQDSTLYLIKIEGPDPDEPDWPYCQIGGADFGLVDLLKTTLSLTDENIYPAQAQAYSDARSKCDCIYQAIEAAVADQLAGNNPFVIILSDCHALIGDREITDPGFEHVMFLDDKRYEDNITYKDLAERLGDIPHLLIIQSCFSGVNIRYTGKSGAVLSAVPGDVIFNGEYENARLFGAVSRAAQYLASLGEPFDLEQLTTTTIEVLEHMYGKNGFKGERIRADTNSEEKCETLPVFGDANHIFDCKADDDQRYRLFIDSTNSTTFDYSYRSLLEERKPEILEMMPMLGGYCQAHSYINQLIESQQMSTIHTIFGIPIPGPVEALLS